MKMIEGIEDNGLDEQIFGELEVLIGIYCFKLPSTKSGHVITGLLARDSKFY